MTDTDEFLAQATIRVPDHVAYRAFDAETVLLNLTTGWYHGVTGAGGRMLELLDETGSVQETAASIAAEFGLPVAEIKADVLTLCRDLAERGLIEAT